MIKCFICDTNHLNGYAKCDEIINLMINKYKNININDYDDEIKELIKKRNKNKKYKCEKCNMFLSSYKNYKLHIEKNTCDKHIKEFCCDNCNKTFSKKQSLQYHKDKNVCGLKFKQLDKNKIINTSNNVQIPEVSEAKTCFTNIKNQQNIGTQNIGSQNINNVVINVNQNQIVDMLPFRDVSYKIPTKKYLEYANNPDQAIKQFVKDYHLNPDKPDRMNVLNTNRRDNRVQLFDFDEDFICRWQTKDKYKVMELLCDRGVNALFFAKTMLAAAGVKLNPEKEKQLNAKIKEYESSDKIKKKYIDMIADLTYDYRDVVELNKNKVKSQQLQLV
jgi:hypothetical protein